MSGATKLMFPLFGQDPPRALAPARDVAPPEVDGVANLALALSATGTVLGAYHGYMRNDSVGWAVGWALLGGMFPLITIPVSLAQGFGKPAR